MRPKLDKKSQDELNKLRSLLSDKGLAPVLQKAVREIGLEAQEQMTHNLSATLVHWSEGSFQIGVITGNLRRRVRMDYPFAGDKYSCFISNDAAYARLIEYGLSGRLKKQVLLDGPGTKISKAGRRYRRIPAGRGAPMEVWTLTEDTKLPDSPPKPFVRATAEQMRPVALKRLGYAFAEALD